MRYKFALSIAFLLLATVVVPGRAQEPEGVERSAPPQPSGNCSPALGGAGPSHPLQEVVIEHSQELKGREKEPMVRGVLQTSDVRNVLGESPIVLDPTRAMVVISTLDTGNTLLAMSVPMEKGILIYYELAEPLVEAGKRFRSQAVLYAIESETVRLISTSMNGRLVTLLPSPAGRATLASGPCGDCTDIFQWDYLTSYCTGYSGSCLIGCGIGCGVCAITCAECIATGNGWACAKCIGCALGCGWCASNCCQQWETGCASCGPMP